MNDSDSKSPALNSAVLLAAATAYLYCVSTAHYGGYLSPLRLDGDVLDRNFHQALYSGFLISFTPAFVVLFSYGAARLTYSHCILPTINDWLRNSIPRCRSFLKLRRGLFGERKISSYERKQKHHTMSVLLYVALAFAFILSLVYFESLGKKAALGTIDRMVATSTPSSEMVRVKIDDQIRSLFYLGCGARNCAAIDASTKMVYYFPQNGHSYQYAVVAPSSPSSVGARKAP